VGKRFSDWLSCISSSTRSRCYLKNQNKNVFNWKKKLSRLINNFSHSPRHTWARLRLRSARAPHFRIFVQYLFDSLFKNWFRAIECTNCLELKEVYQPDQTETDGRPFRELSNELLWNCGNFGVSWQSGSSTEQSPK